MLKAKDVINSIENFVDALINTRYIDELELWEYLRAFSEMKVNRLKALDPSRNR
jgi:hypothetical protein